MLQLILSNTLTVCHFKSDKIQMANSSIVYNTNAMSSTTISVREVVGEPYFLSLKTV